MAEGRENETEFISAEELLEQAEETRKEQRSQVTYEQVKNIRRAGELYREVEDITAVAEDIGVPENSAEEALTVYRLIFQNPSHDVAIRAIIPGRTFFSLDYNGVKQDDQDEESVENLLREFVGAIYLSCDVDEEQVGDPPSESTPQITTLSEKLSGVDADIFQSTSISRLTTDIADPLHELSELVTQSVTSEMTTLSSQLINPEDFLPQQNLLRATSSLNAFNKLRTRHISIASNISDTIQNNLLDWQDYQSAMIKAAMPSPAIAMATLSPLKNAYIPQPVLADLTTIEPTIGAAVTETLTDEKPPTSVRKNPATIESAEITQPALEAETAELVVDSTLPDSTIFSVEVVCDVSAMITEGVLLAKDTQKWFSELPQEYQDAVVMLLLITVCTALGGDSLAITCIVAISPAVRRKISDRQRSEQNNAE